IKFDGIYVLRIILFVLSIILSTYLLKEITTSWVYNIFITSIVMVVLSFVFKIFRIKDVTSLLKASKE
ncbi:MAG: hypothetical protein PHV76_06175, partial [Bacteroidales bacterium]|nr:hypothetical protein [Bacteroidales bacterium]